MMDYHSSRDSKTSHSIPCLTLEYLPDECHRKELSLSSTSLPSSVFVCVLACVWASCGCVDIKVTLGIYLVSMINVPYIHVIEQLLSGWRCWFFWGGGLGNRIFWRETHIDVTLEHL